MLTNESVSNRDDRAWQWIAARIASAIGQSQSVLRFVFLLLLPFAVAHTAVAKTPLNATEPGVLNARPAGLLPVADTTAPATIKLAQQRANKKGKKARKGKGKNAGKGQGAGNRKGAARRNQGGNAKRRAGGKPKARPNNNAKRNNAAAKRNAKAAQRKAAQRKAAAAKKRKGANKRKAINKRKAANKRKATRKQGKGAGQRAGSGKRGTGAGKRAGGGQRGTGAGKRGAGGQRATGSGKRAGGGKRGTGAGQRAGGGNRGTGAGKRGTGGGQRAGGGNRGTGAGTRAGGGNRGQNAGNRGANANRSLSNTKRLRRSLRRTRRNRVIVLRPGVPNAGRARRFRARIRRLRDRTGQVRTIRSRRIYVRPARYRNRFVNGRSIYAVPPIAGLAIGLYLLEASRASREDYVTALRADPIFEGPPRRYDLDEIIEDPGIRSRTRAIDLNTIEFSFGSTRLTERAIDQLEELADAMLLVLDDNPGAVFLIEGHTDAVGSFETNLALSEDRAAAVVEVLVSEFGVPEESLEAVGYGEQYLRVDTPGPDRRNRRVLVRSIGDLLKPQVGYQPDF